MIAFDLIQWMVRSVVYAGWLFKHRYWKREAMAVLRAPDVVEQCLEPVTPAISEPVAADVVPTAPLEHRVPVPDAEFLGGQALIRYGEGFSVVCHFYRRHAWVTRVVWLDYKKLQRKHGAYVIRRLRTRAGEPAVRVRPVPRHADGTSRSWGRIALPDEYLEFDSLQDLRVVKLMEKTLDDAATLIEEEIPENLINKRPWRLLPPSPAPQPELTDLEKRRKTVELSMMEMREEDAARKIPLASREKVYPNMVPPPVVRSHSGVLRKTGYVVRTDPSGRTYRTFFAEVEDAVRTIRHIGVDLQRALLREQVDIGDRVEVFNIGLVPVGSGKYKKKIWSARKLPVS